MPSEYCSKGAYYLFKNTCNFFKLGYRLCKCWKGVGLRLQEEERQPWGRGKGPGVEGRRVWMPIPHAHWRGGHFEPVVLLYPASVKSPVKWWPRLAYLSIRPWSERQPASLLWWPPTPPWTHSNITSSRKPSWPSLTRCSSWLRPPSVRFPPQNQQVAGKVSLSLSALVHAHSLRDSAKI